MMIIINNEKIHKIYIKNTSHYKSMQELIKIDKKNIKHAYIKNCIIKGTHILLNKQERTKE